MNIDLSQMVTAETRAAAAKREFDDRVNAERAKRTARGNTFGAVYVTGRPQDIDTLNALAIGAQVRIMTGDETFIKFRDGTNVDHMLSPSQVLSLWQLSAEYVTALYEASWALKALDPAPADPCDDSHWPDWHAPA